MIYFISGKLTITKSQFIVVEAAGIGFKIFVSLQTLKQLPKIGSNVKIFCSIYFHKNGVDIYGFLKEKEKDLFGLIGEIPGVGPKSSLAILDNFSTEKFLSAVEEGRADLLSKAWGVGEKKAQRIILELKGKIKGKRSKGEIFLLESDIEIGTALKNLGYKQKEIQEAVKNIPSKAKKTEERLKIALKFLSKMY